MMSLEAEIERLATVELERANKEHKQNISNT